MRAPAAATANSNPLEEKKLRPFENNNSRNPAHSDMPKSPASPRRPCESSFGKPDEPSQSEYVTNAIQGLSLVKDAATPQSGPQSAESGESLEDDQSHLSNSSTKQQSFDTKSMASVTTFAMDEKESIRPDDSASVRAAEDDEASNAPSRELSFHRDSEPLASPTRTSSRPNTSGVTIVARRYHTLTLTNPPRFGDLPVIPIVEAENLDQQSRPEASAEQPPESHERAPSLPIAPDEKLLDALATPKDRLPLLQLEEKFLGFIANPESEFLDLPPQNSFARLLAHKLADYYCLAHRINEDGTSIRVFKTPCVSIPTPLHVLAQSVPAGPAQPPSAMAVKIMRRAGLGPRQASAGGSTPASSSVPSKTTSEAGLETNSEEGVVSPVDGTPNKDKSKLTREEREAQYKAARERIFGDFQESVTSESASTGENSASISRSSSSSGKRKTRKHKTPKDDSFEARSAFIPSYSPMHAPNLHQQYPPQYSEQVYQGPYQGPTSGFGANVNYGTTPTSSYPNFDQSMQYNSPVGYGPNGNQQFSPSDSWSSIQSPSSTGYFSYSASPASYQQHIPPMMTQMNNQFMQQPRSGMQQSQNWMNNQFAAPYHPPPGSANSNMNGWSGYQPTAAINNSATYAYGQLPGQNFAGSPTYNTHHPGPGTFPRSLFNPQTRSFVPSNTPSRTAGRNGRKKPSPSPSQNRASTDNSGIPAVLSPRGFEKGPRNSSSPKPKEDSLQQKYGAPAHLPKKPPPSQVPSSYDVESISNTTLTSGPLALNGGAAGSGPASGS
ncbi:uncharacterized protein Z518_01074 [Rhinocladiella mackenziei CBS 650.93]|uniref:R3H domain-containing protein n=1 Tax=Rhinocladiella mackenziei CBS 650.93 TaxID=1442369 RepID=A0A0D2HH90_9EURO|nr:uncharacterized protein Z518_01074 [Rhinocladiella mackenziei CBS 650.93]KIX09993.1 hypothetical protein Z518_01074 [Rhinocladiella mackenziei CBS 650.93]